MSENQLAEPFTVFLNKVESVTGGGLLGHPSVSLEPIMQGS